MRRIKRVRGECHPLSKGLSLKRLGRDRTQTSGSSGHGTPLELPWELCHQSSQATTSKGSERTGPLHKGVGTCGSHLCFSKVLHRVRKSREKLKGRGMPEMNPVQKIPHTSPQ